MELTGTTINIERSRIVTSGIVIPAALLIGGILMSCSKAPENLEVVDKSASHFTLEWQKKSDNSWDKVYLGYLQLPTK